jgi:hypothetical protein
MKLSRTQLFVVSVALLTVGVCLMLIGIGWLMLLGAALVAYSDLVSRRQSSVQRKGDFGLIVRMVLLTVALLLLDLYVGGVVFTRTPNSFSVGIHFIRRSLVLWCSERDSSVEVQPSPTQCLTSRRRSRPLLPIAVPLFRFT